MLFKSRKDLLQALTGLRNMSQGEATSKQLSDWLHANRRQLKDLAIEHDMEKLVTQGQIERALRLYTQCAFGRIARNAGLNGGIWVLTATLVAVFARSPGMQPLGLWFFVLLALVGAVIFGCGYRIYKHPQSDTVYTQGRYFGARTAKSSDGVFLMLLSGVFLVFAIAGDLLLPYFL